MPAARLDVKRDPLIALAMSGLQRIQALLGVSDIPAKDPVVLARTRI
jgi:hypothetical protein